MKRRAFECARRFFVETYATLDERSLGLGRIVLALALLTDLGKRVPGLRAWYSNEGLLPNHMLLWSPASEHTFSFFFMASTPYEAAVGFVLCAVAYLFLLVGYRTRLAQIASFAGVLSLHGRVIFLQIGGDVALSELAFWTLFLPLGRRFSIDSLLRELRALERGETRREPEHAVTSLACFALLLQLASVYALNALQKSGRMWVDGSLLHYVLHLDALVTRLGIFLREGLTPGLSAFLTHSTRIGEALVPILLLFPLGTKTARSLAIVTLVGLHVGFAALINVGLFSLVMISYAPNFVPSRVWDFWEKRRSRRGPDEAHPRNAAREFAVDIREIAAEPSKLVERLSAMPFGKTLLEVAALPYGKKLLVGLARRAVRCAKRSLAVEAHVSAERAPSLGRRRLSAVTVSLALYLCIARAGVENAVIPRALRAPLPAWGSAIVHYLQLFQGWQMFAPEAMRGDLALAVDAVTRGGRHVDPFNEFARPGRARFDDRIPKRLGYDVYENAYFGRIFEVPAYHRVLGEWILRYHERTGRPEDEVVSFTVLMLTDESPPPGQREPKNVRRTVAFGYPNQTP